MNMDENSQYTQENMTQNPQGEISTSNYEIDHLKVGIFFGLVALVFFTFYILTKSTNNSIPLFDRKTGEEEAPMVAKANPFKDIELEAKAAFVWDVEKQEAIFGQNEEIQLPLASLTKLMTVSTAADFIDKDRIITISDSYLNVEGDSGLLEHERWAFKNLVDFTLLVSSNDGANAIASIANAVARKETPETGAPQNLFIEKMNNKAKRIGLKQTYFVNETGLDPNELVSGGYGSARDMAILLDYMVNHENSLLRATQYNNQNIVSQSNFTHTATNTNVLAKKIPGLIASKTGFTDLAGGNLAVAFNTGIGNPIVIVVLGSTLEGRFEDVDKLVQAALEYN